MEIILLESIRKLGSAGSKVRVKDGYGRNYLIPLKKAIRATKENLIEFEKNRLIIEDNNAKIRDSALIFAEKIDGACIDIVRQAGEDGRLFGSVNARDISIAIQEKGFGEVMRSQIILNQPIKNIGIHSITLSLHPDVNVLVKINVVRSLEEARFER